MRQITKVQFLELYERGMLTETVYVGDRVIARSVEGQADNPNRYEVVWAALP